MAQKKRKASEIETNKLKDKPVAKAQKSESGKRKS